MAQLMFPNIAGSTFQGFQQGQQMRANRLVGAAMQNPDDSQSYLAQAGAIDPRLAMGVQDAMQQQQALQQKTQQAQQEQKAKQIGGMARYYKAALQSNNPAAVAAARSAIGPTMLSLTGKQLPDTDTPDTLAALDNVIAQTSYLFPDEAKSQIVTPGSTVRQYGVNVYSNPAAPKITPQGYQAVMGPDGTYHAEPIQIQGAGNGMGMGQAVPGAGASVPPQAQAPNVGVPAPSSIIDNPVPPGTQVSSATGPDGTRVAFAFAPDTPDAVQVQTGAMAGVPQGAPQAAAQPSQGQPQTLAQVVAAGKGASTDLIAQRQQQIQHLKAAGVDMSPEDEQQYLLTGKASNFQGGSSAALFGDPTKSGPQYIQSIPSGNQEIVKGLLDGTVSLPTGTTLKSPLWQSALASVKHADPSWNQAAFKQYADTRKWATTGQGGQLINNINTASYHLDKLREDIDALHNGNYSLLNTAGNAISQGTGGQAVTNFNADLTPVASELAAVYKGKGVPSDAEISHFMTALTPNMSHGQQMNIIKGWIDLLAGKLNSTREQYQSGMSKLSSPLSVINPHAAEALERITTLANQVSNTGQHAMPAQDTSPIYAPGGETQPAPAAAGAPSGVDSLLSKYGIQ